jgi:acyl-CoA thioester hydrolase
MGLSGHLEGGQHSLDVRVYYEDTDFSGVVYHANYLKFCERGRSDMLRLAGVHHTELAQEGLGFVVTRMDCEFRRPARIDDVVTVVTRPARIKRASFVLFQQIFRGRSLLFEAQVTVAMVDAQGKPHRIPEALARRLAAAVDGKS